MLKEQTLFGETGKVEKIQDEVLEELTKQKNFVKVGNWMVAEFGDLEND